VQVLGILHLKKLITLERVTQDGTKVRANVNKKTFTRESKIRAHLQLAEQQVREMEAAEEQEKRTRQAAAKKRAQRERQEQLQQALEEVQRLQKQKKWEKNKPCQASVTDADAQFMRTGDHGLAPCYNVQLTTDAVHGLIVGVGVRKDPSDAAHLMPAMERVKQTLGQYPQEVVADGDYTNRESVIAAAERGVDFYGSWSAIDGQPGHGIEPDFHPRMFTHDERRNEFICPQGKRLSYRTTWRGPGGPADHVFVAQKQDCQACPKRAQCTPHNRMQKHGRALSVRLEDERVERFKDKMDTAEAKAIYRQRSRIAQFPHAWLKCKLNFVRFRCRGLTKATTEAFWVCLTHNLQRYFGLQRLRAA